MSKKYLDANGLSYVWSKIKNSLDSKRQVFYDTPTVPYDLGDLWVQGSTGDILRCATAKTSEQSYSASDWILASKYTDNTVATRAENKVNTLTSVAVTNVEVQYAKGDDNETAPTSGWSTATPEWEAGKYIWQRTVTTANGVELVSNVSCIQGAKGDTGAQGAQGPKGDTGAQGPKGDDGATISEVLYSTDNSTWSSTEPSLSKGDWLYIKTMYTDGTYAISKSYVGTDGEDGQSVSIRSTSKVGDTTTVVFSDGTSISITDGADGDEGTPGAPGANGQTSYTHFAWANSADGTVDFSTTDSTDKEYIGVYSDFTITDSSLPGSYSWTLIKGEKGDDGATIVLIEYSKNGGSWSTTEPSLSKGDWLYIRTTYSDGSTATSKSYVGTDGDDGQSVTIVSSSKVDGVTTVVFSDGTQVSIVDGEDGSSGTPGTPGADGRTSYTHFAWANSSDGSTDFSTTESTNKKYIGVYSDFTQADSTTPGDYSWTLTKGEQGVQGDKGDKGDTGKGISSITEYYAINNSTTAPADSAFDTSIKTPTAGNKYVWNYELITYTDSSTLKTTKHIASTYGDTGSAGRGIVSITNYYARSQTTAVPADSAFDTSIPTITSTYKYMWNYEVTTYENGTPATTRTDKRIIAVYGDKGNDGVSPTVSKDGDTVTIIDASGNIVTVKDGTDGQSIKGDDGEDAYVHIAWANSSDGTVDFSTTNATNKLYMGTYTDHVLADSTTPSSYKWVKIKGEQGDKGDTPEITADKSGGTTTISADGIVIATILDGSDGAAGRSPTITTSKTGNITTIYADGVVIGTVADGDDGTTPTVTANKSGTSTTIYINGQAAATINDGDDGYSPTVSTSKSGDITTITVTDALGTHTATIVDGQDGADGLSPTVSKTGKVVTITDADGNTVTVTDGEDGQSIKGDAGDDAYLHIAWANSSDGSVDFSTIVATNKLYMGTYTDHTQADSQTYSDYTWVKVKGEQGVQGPQGTSITISTIRYAVSTTDSQPSDNDFTYTSVPTVSEGSWLWTRTLYSDGSKVYTKAKQGEKGSTGPAKYTWIKYADSPNSGMSDSPTGKSYIGFAYNKDTPTESTTYGDYEWSLIKGDKGDTGSQGPKGDTGDDGKGISSITYYYKATSTQTQPSASDIISTEIPTLDATTNKYLWQKEVIAYTIGNSQTTISLLGVYGSTGPQGPQGSTGATGKGISSLTPQYYLSIDNQSAMGGSWSDTPPEYVSGKYYWTRTLVTYDDGTTAYAPSSSGVLDNPLTTMNSNAYQALVAAGNAEDIAEAQSQHFWADNDGVHIASEAETPAATRNSLWNSLGMLFRNGVNNIVAILTGQDRKGLVVYDGQGNDDENEVASFTDSGSVIGKAKERRLELKANSMDLYDVGSRRVFSVLNTTSDTLGTVYEFAVNRGDNKGVGTYTYQLGLPYEGDLVVELLFYDEPNFAGGYGEEYSLNDGDFGNFTFSNVLMSASGNLSFDTDTNTVTLVLSSLTSGYHLSRFVISYTSYPQYPTVFIGANGDTFDIKDYALVVASPDWEHNALTIDRDGHINTDGSVTAYNHSSPIGTVIDSYLETAKNATSGTWVEICNITLDPGVWLITCGVRWPSSSTGYRRLNISETSADNTVNLSVVPVNGTVTQTRMSRVFNLTTQKTYYLNATHNAGTTLSMPAGGAESINFMRATRIA